MQKYALKNGAIHIPIKKKWVSHIKFPWKKGLIVYMYLAALKKGAIRAEQPYHFIYRDITPPPRVEIPKKLHTSVDKRLICKII